MEGTLRFMAVLVAACFLAAALGTGIVLWGLRRWGITDIPNDRSSHARPTPRGGGLAVVPVVLLAWLILSILGVAPLRSLGIVGVAGGLAALSWRDDRMGLPVSWRLGAQVVAVVLGIACLPGAGMVFQGLLPPVLDVIASALIWLWFVNLFNFMDGIDGLAAGEAVAIGLGLAIVAGLSSETSEGLEPLGLVLAAAAGGFLLWNWHPAKLFLGDVGSIPLGYICGWLLLAMAARHLWAPALILPLYFIADATITLILRAVRLEPVWRAHREHFYQQAVQRGRSHAWVSTRIAAGNAALVLIALLGLAWPWIATVLAVILVAALLVYLTRGALIEET